MASSKDCEKRIVAAQPEQQHVEPGMGIEIGGRMHQTIAIQRDGLVGAPQLLQDFTLAGMYARQIRRQLQRAAVMRQARFQLALRFEGVAQSQFGDGGVGGCARQASQLLQHRHRFGGQVHRQQDAGKPLQRGRKLRMLCQHRAIALFRRAQIADLVMQDGEIETRLQHHRLRRQCGLQAGDGFGDAAFGFQAIGGQDGIGLVHAGSAVAGLMSIDLRRRSGEFAITARHRGGEN